MARIRATMRDWNTVVIVSGRLGAGDLRRLEHACSPTLTSAQAPLTLDLTRATEIDAVAGALIRRMAMRGAVIRTSPPATATGDDTD
jgi:hypothetical protein